MEWLLPRSKNCNGNSQETLCIDSATYRGLVIDKTGMTVVKQGAFLPLQLCTLSRPSPGFFL